LTFDVTLKEGKPLALHELNTHFPFLREFFRNEIFWILFIFLILGEYFFQYGLLAAGSLAPSVLISFSVISFSPLQPSFPAEQVLSAAHLLGHQESHRKMVPPTKTWQVLKEVMFLNSCSVQRGLSLSGKCYVRVRRHWCAEGHWVPQSLTFLVIRARHEYCPLSQ